MSKFAALAIGLLTVISIAPQSQAATTITPLAVERSTGDIAQITVKIGGQPQYSNRWEVRRRQLELEREREREREAERRRRKYSSRRDYNRYDGYYRR